MRTCKVLCFGTFDLLHPGHVHFLQEAKMFGDRLYVVIARDKSVNTIKKMIPDENEETRKKNVQQLPCVTQAILGHENDYYKIIEEIRPDIICLGYDQNEMNLARELKKRKITAEVKRLSPFHPEKYKSSISKKLMGE